MLSGDMRMQKQAEMQIYSYLREIQLQEQLRQHLNNHMDSQ